MDAMRVRLADVAARAGVSEATVSRVLNDKPGVAAENRRAILTTMEELGYQRPRRRERADGLVGLIVPELDNPVFPAFAQGIETVLARHGFTPVLCTQTQAGAHEDEYVSMLLDRRVSGIIFVSGMHANTETDPGRYARLREQELPIVLINGYVAGVDAPFLSVDDGAGMDLAVGHLAALGHRSIGLAVGPVRYVPVQRKLAAFDAAMRRHVSADLGAADLSRLVEHTVFSVDGGAEATATLLDRGVSAVICASDMMALGAIREGHQRGLRLPEELSVIGTDGIPFAEFVHPALTTLQTPVEEMAEAAANALLTEIAGERAPRAEYVFRPQLVVRASTGRPGGAGTKRSARRVS